ncbi:hypothetical protein ES708_25548 [subsurface metagenome]
MGVHRNILQKTCNRVYGCISFNTQGFSHWVLITKISFGGFLCHNQTSRLCQGSFRVAFNKVKAEYIKKG